MSPNKLKKTKILIIEDNRLLREGITVMINSQPDLKVIGAVSDTEESLHKIYELKPDVIIVDLGLSNLSSMEIVKTIKDKYPDFRIIVMDLLPIESDILDFVKAGVSGFILKDAMVNDFLKTIRLVASGEKVLPHHMTGSLFTQIIETAIKSKKKVAVKDSVMMTRREKEVVELIADGLTNKEIGLILHLSPFTVKSHVHNILEKMALHTRLQIARYSYANKEVTDT
ncbi:MAG: response regulator transcription factor [Candidatus Kapaibacterium sp.]